MPAEARAFGLKNAELTIVPKPQQMAGRQYQAGLRVKGDGTIANLQASLDISANYTNGVNGSGSVSPILLKQGNTVIFRLSGNKETDPSTMSVDMTLSNLLVGHNPFIRVDGYISLLGLVSQSHVDISKQGFYLTTSGKVFDKFSADLDLRGGNLQKASGMSVRAALKNDLTGYLSDEIQNALNTNTSAEQAAYRKAKEDLLAAENYLRKSQDSVDAFNSFQKTVNDQRAEVDKWRRQADQTKRRLDSLSRWDLVGKGKLGSQWIFEKGKAEAASTTLDAANVTLEGLKIAVDWTQREAMTKVLEAARVVVTEFEKAAPGGKQVAKWIVDKGLGGVIDVKSAEFQGNLDVVSGGKVKLQVNVSFLSQAYHAGFDFDFHNPAGFVSTLANALINNQAIAGAQATLVGQIGHGWGG